MSNRTATSIIARLSSTGATAALIACGQAIYPEAAAGNPQAGSGGSDQADAAIGGASGAPALPSQRGFEIDGLAWGAGQFVAVGHVGTDLASSPRTGMIYASVDGLSWELVADQLPVPLRDVAFGNGRFVALGGPSDARVYVSSDGMDWSPTPLPRAEVAPHFAFGNGVFVAAPMNEANVLVSSDGTTWNVIPSGLAIVPEAYAAGVEYGANTFALWQALGNIEISSNGENWSQVQGYPLTDMFGREDALVGIAEFKCCFGEVPPTYGGVESTNGTTWTDLQDAAMPVLVSATACVQFFGPYGGPVTTGCAGERTRLTSLLYGYTVLQSQGVTLIGGGNGIAASTDGDAWRLVLADTPP